MTRSKVAHGKAHVPEVLQGDERLGTVLGSKIRSLRQHLKLTLDETATRAGISTAFLSQIERGLARPSVNSLMAIARALDVNVEYLLDAPREQRSITRGNALSFFGFANRSNQFARLTQVMEGGRIEAVLVRVPAGQKLAEVAMRTGEQFWYVLTGTVALTLRDKTVAMREGDSAHYDSADAHGWENTGDEEAVLVWVGTPALL
ncbi:MAG TPA: XRE family transcriptional regulator [Trinickia sp.]|jgi:transcriptional regulator with XRE-family HTH domain|nr:XRE family transcriptional regulator [Trinickia sp.]